MGLSLDDGAAREDAKILPVLWRALFDSLSAADRAWVVDCLHRHRDDEPLARL